MPRAMVDETYVIFQPAFSEPTMLMATSLVGEDAAEGLPEDDGMVGPRAAQRRRGHEREVPQVDDAEEPAVASEPLRAAAAAVGALDRRWPRSPCC